MKNTLYAESAKSRCERTNTCRVCGTELYAPIYESAAPSITSICTMIDMPLSIFSCHNCSHVQSGDLDDIQSFYEKEYRISMQSKEFDQLYDIVNSQPIYRTDYQAEIVLKFIDVPFGSRVLDYGAAKAATLSKILEKRPDIVPFVFDVSDDYKIYWNHFVPQEQQAVFEIPDAWARTFSLITAHFVLEHVQNPSAIFKNMVELLAPDGVIFFTVPDVIANPGDFIVADHINHYSVLSINRALSNADLALNILDRNILRGSIVCTAQHINRSTARTWQDPRFKSDVQNVACYWTAFDKKLDTAAKSFCNSPSAIFGAGFYGTYIASKIMNRTMCKCFLDNNPHLNNALHMGLSVLSPADMPQEIEVLFAGLNPKIAHSVIESFRKEINREINVIFFDE